MLSVLVLALRTRDTAPSPGEAVRTLSALVPAVVEGLVRDVALVAAPPNGDFTHVADHAGCVLVEASSPKEALAAGARHCRCSHVLVLAAGVMVERPFLDELSGLMPTLPGASQAPVRVLKASGTGWLARLSPSFAPTAGVLTIRDTIVRSGAATLAQLERAGSARRLFRSRAWVGD